MNKLIKIIKNRVNAYILLLKNTKGINAEILNENDTINDILNNRKSLIRLGDGEFAFLYGNGIHYQKYEKEIEVKLIKIIKEYNDKSKYILCVPRFFFQCNGLRLIKRVAYVLAWSRPRDYFKKNFNKNIIYGDAFLFAKGREEDYKRIFESAKNIVFIHNSSKYAKFFEEKYNKKVEFIKIPEKDSYSVIQEVQEQIEKIVGNDKQEWLVLVSAGPMAKILTDNLSKKDIWTIDTGHCWDNPLHEGEKVKCQK